MKIQSSVPKGKQVVTHLLRQRRNSISSGSKFSFSSLLSLGSHHQNLCVKFTIQFSYRKAAFVAFELFQGHRWRLKSGVSVF